MKYIILGNNGLSVSVITEIDIIIPLVKDALDLIILRKTTFDN